MVRYGRTVIIIVIAVALAGGILGFQKISLGEFERGDDTPLGLSLGLDLQGGGHLVYQANLTDPETGETRIDPDTGDVVKVTEDQMESLKKAIERRVNSAGLGEPIIQILGSDRLLVQLPGVTDLQRAKEIIGETAQLVFKRRELNVPREADEITTDDVLRVSVDFLPDLNPADDQVSETATSTPAAAGESETATSTPEDAESAPEDRPVVFLVEFTDAGAPEFQVILDRVTERYIDALTKLQLGERGYPSFIEILIDGSQRLRYQIDPLSIIQVATTTTYAIAVPVEATTNEQPSLEVMKERVGDNAQISFIELQGSVDEDTSLTGDDLARAFPGQHTASGLPIVNLEFDDRGTRIFGELTQDIIVKQQETGIRDQIAIFLDGDELISPEVNAVITSGTAIIEGRQDFTVERVRNLALLLEAGRLPVPIRLIQERAVDAILGADSLAKSVVAGLIGLALVLVFMVLYYRLPGLVAAVALLIYVSIVLAIFKIVPVTLTLSGVAAIILSIGMAVDANILIFERMKEELRAGRTLLSSINFGFDRAWPAIRDGNVSTLITCAILFWFADQLGASIVQGFAVSLAIGVSVSMFTAITVSRTLLRFVATARFTRSIRIWLPSGGSEVPQQYLTDAAE